MSGHNPALRATFLRRLATPEDIQGAAWLGDLFDTFINEGGLFGPPEDRRPGTFRDVDSAAAELDAIAAFLEGVASTPNESILQPTEYPLCAAASGWAGQARATAAAIRRALQADQKAGPVGAEPAEEADRLAKLTEAVRRLLTDAARLRPEAADGAVGQLAGHLRDALDGLEAEPG